MVGGIEVAFPQRLQRFADLLLGAYRVDVGEKFATSLPTSGLYGRLNGQIAILCHAYFTLLNILSQRILRGNDSLGSSESHTNEALPTM